MITSSREVDCRAKQEVNASDGKNSKSSSSSTPWLRLKDPRIVRVSRAFGGKDRHSKVCTVRGLRDRRVRLSVSTAIQLYDLQDRLGFNQPSKVVDWLLNAAKNEIDGLPPLQMPSGNFIQNHHLLPTSHEVGAYLSNKEELKIDTSIVSEDPMAIPRSNFWNSDALLKAKSKEVAREAVNEKEIWIKRNEEEKQEAVEGHGAQVSSNNFFPRANHSSLPGFLNNVMPYNSHCHWETSNFSLSHLGSQGFTSQTADLHNFNVVPLPSTLSQTSGSQVLVCPPGTTQSYFPSHVTTSVQINPRQISNFQMLTSNSQNLLPNSVTPHLYSLSQSMKSPFHLSMNPKVTQSNKDSEFPSK